MSSFNELMRLSQEQTARSERDAQVALLEKRRKDEAQRRAREERERQDQERAKQLRLKRLEDERREAEQLQRKLEQEKAREAAQLRKEEEQRNSLVYGAKRSGSNPSSRPQNGKYRSIDEDDGQAAGEVLTREEIRRRKQEAEQRKMFSAPKRSSHSGRGSKKSDKLKGGAVDVVTNKPTHNSTSKGGTKERIAAEPIGLIKLNIVKRDTRTIDEIQRDLDAAKRNKVLEGDSAKTFNDWFSPAKKEKSKKHEPIAAPPVDSPASSLGSSSGQTPALTPSAPVVKKTPAPVKTVAPQPTKPHVRHFMSSSKPAISRPSSSSTDRNNSKASSRTHTPSTVPKSTQNGSASTPHSKKRPRSSTRSESPPPRKQRLDGPGMDAPTHFKYIPGSISALFGMNQSKYMERNVYSDDEDDMEVDAFDLEREEMISARIAKREDDEAYLEEKRREAEKARRRKEKLGR